MVQTHYEVASLDKPTLDTR